MKIHMRPPLATLPLAPLPKLPPNAYRLEMQAGELTKVAQQQKDRLKKLYRVRKNSGDLDEDTDSESQERDHRSKRNLNLLA